MHLPGVAHLVPELLQQQVVGALQDAVSYPGIWEDALVEGQEHLPLQQALVAM